MRRTKKNEGITLIALVITIIVLLILAGVAISMLTGENGILQQASEASKRTKETSTEEQMKLAVVDAMMKGNDLTKIENVTDLNEALKSQGLNVTATGDETNGYELNIGDKTYKISNSGEIKEIQKNMANAGTWVVGENGKYTNETQGITITKGDYISNLNINYSSVESTVSNVPTNYDNKWRVLSIKEENGSTCIRLVSAGIPLEYQTWLDSNNTPDTDIYNLTTGFFETQMNTATVEHNKFTKCGFKNTNNNAITTTNEMKDLFKNNNYIAKDANGIAKVQSMTKEDLDIIYGEELKFDTYYNFTDFATTGSKNVIILATKKEEYNSIWEFYPGASDDANPDANGYVFMAAMSSAYCDATGVRPVITLRSDIILEPTENINGVTAWKITN